MPLNEEEQRILSQIEQSFYDNDPGIATKLATTTVYRSAGRRVKIAGAVFGLAFLAMLFTYTVSLVLGLLCFFLLLGAAFDAVANLRKMGRAGIADLNKNLRDRATKASQTSNPFRDRFRRPDSDRDD